MKFPILILGYVITCANFEEIYNPTEAINQNFTSRTDNSMNLKIAITGIGKGRDISNFLNFKFCGDFYIIAGPDFEEIYNLIEAIK